MSVVGVSQLTRGSVFGDVIGGLSLLLAVTNLVWLLPRQVSVDAAGLHRRGAWWRTTTVPWDDVADIRPAKDRPGHELAIVHRDGTLLSTGLHPVEHRTLKRHWQQVTT